MGNPVYATQVLPDVAGIIDGVKVVTTHGTAVPLVATPTFAKYVWISAQSTNTNRVMVGGSTVVAAVGATARGKPLHVISGIPDVLPMPVPGCDLANIYIDAVSDGEGVMFMALI